MAITKGVQTNTENVTVGAGRLFFDEELSPGEYAGELYLGDTPGFSISVTTEQVDIWNSDTQIAEKLVSVPTQVTRSGTTQLNEANLENLSLFIVGDVDVETQASATATTEVFSSVKLGRHYQLGIDDDHPAGVQSITLTEVTNGSTTTYVEGTDYEVDEAQGRIYILPDGNIPDGDPITATYDVAAGTRSRSVSASVATKRGRVRYLANNTTGKNRHLFMPKVDVRPDGEIALKSRSESVVISLGMEILKPDNGEAMIFYEDQVNS